MTPTFTADGPIFEAASIIKGRHTFADHSMFSDDAISRLFDQVGDKLSINVMGEDPEQTSDWAYCDRAGHSGREILELIATQRLWTNVPRANSENSDFTELEKTFRRSVNTSGERIGKINTNFLVSSPGAQVYYHTDPEWNVLIHFRGRKRIYIYPSDVEAIAPLAIREAIYSGYEEELPFRHDFDKLATPVDLEPGDFVVWPLNGPHRVVNLEGLNVSIALSYESARSHRRQEVGQANEYFRRALRLPNVHLNETGLGTRGKVLTAKVLGKVRKPHRNPQPKSRAPKFRLDPSAPLGYVPIEKVTVPT